LLFLFAQIMVPESVALSAAIATSLAIIIFNALSSISKHWEKRAIRWDLAGYLVPGLVIGALLGSWTATRIQTQWLEAVFMFFLVAIGLRMLLAAKPNPAHEPWQHEQAILGASGVVMGFLSALLGIGGGSFITPYLTWRNIGMHQAIALSATAGLPIALAATLGYVLQKPEVAMPEGFVGYVYWPAMIWIGLSSIVFARLGARLAHNLPAAKLKRWFGLLLLVLALKMAWEFYG
ncbi:MAG: sulfite exporter TauE/SafE family protein, partial [Pseudomonadota bacterium]|nr:sulfite exporter TauE/SafE family protein [Pseudomonadota bacterium]